MTEQTIFNIVIFKKVYYLLQKDEGPKIGLSLCEAVSYILYTKPAFSTHSGKKFLSISPPPPNFFLVSTDVFFSFFVPQGFTHKK
jgi:hypothetical protein